MDTRKVTISSRKKAFMGAEYTDTFIGMRAVFTTWEGERLVGTITHFDSQGQGFPVVTFPNGRWARLDSQIELVNA